jgi:hypothetical protein
VLPGFEEALIGAGALIVTAGGAVYGVRAQIRAAVRQTERSVTSARADVLTQIEASSNDVRQQLAAECEHRVWEQRATVYTDAIATIRHEQKIRGIQIVAAITGTEKERPESPVDTAILEARLVAFCSQPVLDAQRAYFKAAERFYLEYDAWREDGETAREQQEMIASGVMPPILIRRNSRDDLQKLRDEADKLGDEVITLIRSELHTD